MQNIQPANEVLDFFEYLCNEHNKKNMWRWKLAELSIDWMMSTVVGTINRQSVFVDEIYYWQ